MKTLAIALGLQLLACAASESERVSLVYEGEYDHGELRLRVVSDDGRVAQSVVTELPVVGSGPSGTTTPPVDGVLLHQERSRSLDRDCNRPPYVDFAVPRPFRGVCVPMSLTNGFATGLHHVYVQLVYLKYDGPVPGGVVTAYVKSPSDPALGVDNAYGLWSYGKLTSSGRGGDRATRFWYFQTPEAGAASSFRFRAIVLGEVSGR